MHKTKIVYTILTMMAFSLGFAASDDFENDEEKEKATQNAVGTYAITDEDGIPYTFTINEDMTMTAEGKGNKYYGSWEFYRKIVNFKFSGDTNEYPRIQFKADKKGASSYISNTFFIANDGFLYCNSDYEVERHDPDYRLKIKKIK
ncbi:MAG: hypothetical protein IKN15_05830 [Bacteroidaceae bacterium]|nr:hypothetical protein [Bacteroidaceae bacterium]